MKPRIELSPKLLRHYRIRRGLSLKQAGECLRKRPDQSPLSLANMYERIERTGITSPERASAIAVKLGVEVAVLSGERSDEDFGFDWWLESSSFACPPTLLNGTAQLMSRLWDSIERETTCVLYEGFPTHARIQITRSELRLTYKHPDLQHDEPQWWSIRPARRGDKGITWLEFTKHELEALFEHAKDTASWSADFVHINGRQVPEVGSETAYILRNINPDESLPLAERTTDSYFATTGQLCASLARQFKRLGTKSVFVSAAREDLTVSPLLDAGFFVVMRVWRRGGRSPWKRCPWHLTSFRRLGEDVETKLKRSIPDVQFFELDLERKAFVPRRVSCAAPP